jgi:tetratricopeptide (TPR) repeat protein
MDPNNPVVQLCIAGTQAEYQHDMEAACSFYQQAWEAAQNDSDACIAAHYVARCQVSPSAVLEWNQKALAFAENVTDNSVVSFYPSLYLNMGKSYQELGDAAEAQKYYSLAAALGFEHQED